MADRKPGRADSWRWVILPAGFFNMLVLVSINYNCGVINEALIETFEVNTVEASWLMSYYCSLFAIASPLASAVILLTDCRTCVCIAGLLGLVGFASSFLVVSMPVLYITLGLTGVAMSLGQSGSVLSLSYYFPDNLPMVHGVCLAGSGMGSFIHPVLSQVFIDNLGFYGTMLMLAAVSFHATLCGMLLRPNSLEMKSKHFLVNPGESRWKIVRSKIIPPADIFKIPAFVVLIPTVALHSVAFQSMIVILPSYMKSYIGLSIQEGSMAAMVFGAGSVSSRLFSGMAASDENIGESTLFVGMGGLLAVVSFCGELIMEIHHGAYIFSFFFGFYSGGMISLTNTMLMDCVGIELSAHAYGVIMFTLGVSGLTGPPVIAWLVDIQGPYMLFLTCGIISFLVSTLGLMTSYLKKFTSNTGTTPRDMMASVKDLSIYVYQDDIANKTDTNVVKAALLTNNDLHKKHELADDVAGVNAKRNAGIAVNDTEHWNEFREPPCQVLTEDEDVQIRLL